MKFAKTLQEEEVAEWQDYYLDYKLGKKKVKAVQRAIKQLPDLRSQSSTSLQAIQEVDTRRADFFKFLDEQLKKINDFYRAEEQEAARRAELLREQLQTLAEGRRNAALSAVPQPAPTENGNGNGHQAKPSPPPSPSRPTFRQRLMRTISEQKHAVQHAFGHHSTWVPNEHQRDYSRKPERLPPHHVAKRRLKALMQEEYRHLEMIRSFSDMNRTAFRKIIKKYLKETWSLDTGDRVTYMDDKVNKAYFVTSEEVQKLFDEYERLYAEHFERENRKVAASKLRARNVKPMQYVAPCGRAGFAYGAAFVLAILGIVYGAEDLFGVQPYSGQAVYLLQLYGGWFLVLYMAALFVVACAVFNRYRVNYGFIFELDPKSALNWFQMSEIVAWLFLGLGLVMALNFAFQVGGVYFYRYWFVVLMTGTILALALPAPFFYHRARKWIFFTLGRQLIPLFIHVEFRDFLGGDILCSLTYSLGNLFLFACVYDHEWNRPSQCSSSHHWGIGIMTCIPGLIRALQCLKRFWDEKAAFPHLVNFGKYCFTIGQYAFLCVYRLNVTKDWTLALFATVASVNSIYCIVWDIQYDWSLGNFEAKHWGLRETLIFRKHAWVYYVAIVIDVILRLNWIPYCIWTKDAQHASIVSFIVGFSEVSRRGMWIIFRLENEQAANIERRKAVRDMKLPYKFISPASGPLQLDSTPAVEAATAPSLESQTTPTTPAASTLSRIGTRMRTAHVHDYQRRPESTREERYVGDDDDDDDDDE
ncbi:hypothetical protein PRZ48_007458 [Zasmidium cellare]|uniref:Uncharacterized protein n=1 Tax=Zasmidium cellare TaxID=395010 RepID=A0ABR0EJD8_ZASCE|nr:hypothetical protein PRZ48_007458 [Zasmidium cellare]